MAQTDTVMQVRIPADLCVKLDAARKVDDRSRHNMIIKIMRQWLTQQDRKIELNGKGQGLSARQK